MEIEAGTATAVLLGAALAAATAGAIVLATGTAGGREEWDGVRVIVERGDSTYSISGSTEAELRRSLSRGPRGFWGYTRYDIDWHAGFVATGGRCSAVKASVTLKVKVTLPLLRRREGADSCALESYDSMLSSLAAHEEGHVRIAVSGAKRLAEALNALSEGNSCDSLRKSWEERHGAETSSIAAEQSSYDGPTNHGRTEGVMIRPCAVTINDPPP